MEGGCPSLLSTMWIYADAIGGDYLRTDTMGIERKYLLFVHGRIFYYG